ncbi:ABC transporter ATP-binding protein [Massilia sp. W12]|uniref:ABC transporter ATP-binding protein n=1 Tax=Massilia sp. W12 TaxID=3126507 RepID=UPI0030CCDB92
MDGNRQAALAHYVAGDPYDLAAIVLSLLQAAAAQDAARVQQGATILRRMAVQAGILGALHQLQQGGLRCHQLQGRYWLAGAEVSLAALQEADGQIAAALAFGASQLAQPVAPLLLYLNPDFGAMNLAMFDIPGLACLQFPQTLLGQPQMARWLWHETGHAHLRCGQRFLDEGLATWFEYSSSGAFDAAAAQTACAAAAWDLPGALQSGFGKGLAFEDAVEDEAQRAALYPQGALLVARLHARLGGAGLAQLFAAVRAQNGAALPLVRQALADEWDSFHTASATPAHSFTQAQALALRARNDVDGLCAMLAQWEQAQDAASRLAMLDAQISLRELRAPQAAERSKQADLLLADLLRQGGGQALAELQLRHTMSRLMRANSVFERASLGSRAMREADAALRMYPQAYSAQICKATLLIHTPQQYGGDADSGRSMLRQLALRADDYGLVAAAIFRQVYGADALPAPAAVAPESVPDAAPESAQQEEMQPAGAAQLEIQGLRFGDAAGFSLEVDDFSVHSGELLALIGPNGVGKSLLLECCIGLQQASSRVHRICGMDFAAWRRNLSLREQVGARLHRLSFAPDYQVADVLQILRAAYGRQDQALLQRLGLTDLLKKKYGWLSSGQKQRVDLYAAFLPQARLIVLDEPSLGLDDEYSRQLFALIEERRQQGAAVLAVSHEAGFLARCQRIAVLAQGRMQACASPQQIRRAYLSDYRVDLQLAHGNRQHLPALRELGARHVFAQQDSISMLGDQGFLQAFRALAAQHNLLDYQVRACDMSDLFMAAAHASPQALEVAV